MRLTSVLIVEDDADLRYLIRRVIETAEGFTIAAEAGDGPNALETWRSLLRSGMPDVVLLDQRIPGLDGLNVAGQMLTQRPAQVVILYTALLDPRLEDEARRIGVTACFEKADIPDIPRFLRLLPGSEELASEA